jgi:hypothetical protein
VVGDNATVATAWIGSSGHELELADARGLAAGNWVELSDDNAELRRLSGVLARVTKVEGGTLSVSAMRFLPEKSRHMLVIEQYMLTACLKYHRTQRQSPYSGIEIRHVFATLDEALSPHGLRRAGFTHLAAGAKRNRRVSRDLENRVRRELPEFYEHSTNLLQAAL